MVHGHLQRFEAAAVDNHWQKAMQAVERKRARQRGSFEGSDGAAGVGEVHAQGRLARPARDLRRDFPQPGVLPAQPHAADEIDALQFDDEPRQIGGVVLQIAVKRGEDGAGGGLDAGPKRGALPGIAGVPEAAHARIKPPRFRDPCPGVVGARVVHEDEFIRAQQRLHRRRDLPRQRRHVVRLVEHGDDDGNLCGHGASVERAGASSSPGCGQSNSLTTNEHEWTRIGESR